MVLSETIDRAIGHRGEGKPVQQVDTDIWLAEGETVDFYGFPYPTRSVIVRLPEGRCGSGRRSP